MIRGSLGLRANIPTITQMIRYGFPKESIPDHLPTYRNGSYLSVITSRTGPSSPLSRSGSSGDGHRITHVFRSPGSRPAS